MVAYTEDICGCEQQHIQIVFVYACANIIPSCKSCYSLKHIAYIPSWLLSTSLEIDFLYCYTTPLRYKNSAKDWLLFFGILGAKFKYH